MRPPLTTPKALWLLQNMTAAHDIGATDEEAYRIAVASIRRHSMDVEGWGHTVVGELHRGLTKLLALEPGELPIASAYWSTESWWVMTTRRITGCYRGEVSSLDPRYGVDADWGDFKGIKRGEAPNAPGTEVATVTSPKADRPVRFEFETGKASMAPIYGCMFWARATRFRHAVVQGSASINRQ